MSAPILSRRNLLQLLGTLFLTEACRSHTVKQAFLSPVLERLARQALDLEPMRRAAQQYDRENTDDRRASVGAGMDLSNEVDQLRTPHRAIVELIRRGETEIIREILSSGDFRISYTAAMSLVFVPSPNGDRILNLLLNQPRNRFEYSLGMLLLTIRLAHNPSPELLAWRSNIRSERLYPFMLNFFNPTALPQDSSGWRIDNMFAITEFFRQLQALPFISEHLPSNGIVWDIGCSLGQGTLSTLIHLEESRPDFSGRLIATDINPFLLLFAERGVYELSAPSLLGQYRGTATDEDNIKRYFSTTQRPFGNLDRYLASQTRRLDGKKIRTVTQTVRGKIRYGYDDISTRESLVSDRSANITLYYNVHYILPDSIRENALDKIKTKLAPGGFLFFQDPDQEIHRPALERKFGAPVLTISGRDEVHQAILVFQKSGITQH